MSNTSRLRPELKISAEISCDVVVMTFTTVTKSNFNVDHFSPAPRIENEVENLLKMKSLMSKISLKLIPEILGGSLESPETLPGGHVAFRKIFLIVW